MTQRKRGGAGPRAITACAAAAVIGLLSACAGTKPGSSAATPPPPAYGVGPVGTQLSAAASDRDTSMLGRVQARLGLGRSAAAAGSEAAGSGPRPAATRRAEAAPTAAAQRARSIAAAPPGGPAPFSTTAAASAAPESAAPQRVSLDGGVETQPAIAAAPALAAGGAWTERLWLLAALAVLALAAAAGWILRPRRGEASSGLEPPAPAPANDAGAPTRPVRLFDRAPPPPIVTLRAVR